MTEENNESAQCAEENDEFAEYRKVKKQKDEEFRKYGTILEDTELEILAEGAFQDSSYFCSSGKFKLVVEEFRSAPMGCDGGFILGACKDINKAKRQELTSYLAINSFALDIVKFFVSLQPQADNDKPSHDSEEQCNGMESRHDSQKTFYTQDQNSQNNHSEALLPTECKDDCLLPSILSTLLTDDGRMTKLLSYLQERRDEKKLELAWVLRGETPWKCVLKKTPLHPQGELLPGESVIEAFLEQYQ